MSCADSLCDNAELLSEPEVIVSMPSFWSDHSDIHSNAFTALHNSYDSAAVDQLDIMMQGWLADTVVGRVDMHGHPAVRAIVRCNMPALCSFSMGCFLLRPASLSKHV